MSVSCLLICLFACLGSVVDEEVVIERAQSDNTPPILEYFTVEPLTVTPNRLTLVTVHFGFRAEQKDLRGGFISLRPVNIVGTFDYEASDFSYSFNDKRYRKVSGTDEFSFNIMCDGWKSMVLEARVFDRNLLSGQPLTVTIAKTGKKPKEKQGRILGTRAYDFQMYDHQGKIVRLSSFRGKVVLIHFFSGACHFSYDLAKQCDHWVQQYGSKDFIPLCVVYQDKNSHRISRGEAAKWRKSLGLAHPVLEDISAAVRTVFMNHGWAPSYLIIDRNGFIRLNEYGFNECQKDKIEHTVAHWLAQ